MNEPISFILEHLIEYLRFCLVGAVLCVVFYWVRCAKIVVNRRSRHTSLILPEQRVVVHSQRAVPLGPHSGQARMVRSAKANLLGRTALRLHHRLVTLVGRVRVVCRVVAHVHWGETAQVLIVVVYASDAVLVEHAFHMSVEVLYGLDGHLVLRVQQVVKFGRVSADGLATATGTGGATNYDPLIAHLSLCKPLPLFRRHRCRVRLGSGVPQLLRVLDLLKIRNLVLSHILGPRIVTCNHLHHSLRLCEARISLLLVLILPDEHRRLLSRRRTELHVLQVADLAVERLDAVAQALALQIGCRASLVLAKVLGGRHALSSRMEDAAWRI